MEGVNYIRSGEGDAAHSLAPVLDAASEMAWSGIAMS